jgi:hypothetical protein
MYSEDLRVGFQKLIESGNSAEARNFLIQKSKEYDERAKNEIHDTFKHAYEQKSIRLAELSLKAANIAEHENDLKEALKTIESLDKEILKKTQKLSNYLVETVSLCQEFIKTSTPPDQYDDLLAIYDLRADVRTYGFRIPHPKNIFEYLKSIATGRTAIVGNTLTGRPKTYPTFESTYPDSCPMHRLFYSLNEEIYFNIIWNKLRTLTNDVILDAPIEAYKKAAFKAQIQDKQLLSAKYAGTLIFEVRDSIAKRNSEEFNIGPDLYPLNIFHEDLKHCENNIILEAPPPRRSDITQSDMLAGDEFYVSTITLTHSL